MNTSQRQPQDSILDELKSRVAAEVPYCSALILIGSRAKSRNDTYSGLQDYDIVAVLPTWRLPFALRRLKRIEAVVSSTHNVKVTLNPLPGLRLKHPQRNYMLLKLGEEGKVFHGEDVIPRVSALSPKDIDQWWYFFYLASQAKRLLATAPVYKKPDSEVNYNAAKAILGCAELVVLDSGMYTSDADEAQKRLVEIGRSELGEFVRKASDVIDGSKVSFVGAEALWKVSHGLLLSTLDEFSRQFFEVSYFERAPFRNQFLRSGGRMSPIRDLQYATLSLMSRKRCDLRVFANKRGIAERIKLAQFLLLEAHKSDEEFDTHLMTAVRSILPGRHHIENLPPESQWTELARILDIHYPSACIALGV